MNIGFDLDEVLCNIIEPIISYGKLDISYNDIVSYDFLTNSYSQEEFTNLFVNLLNEDCKKFHTILTPVKYSKNVLQKLRKKSNKIMIITARSEILSKQTNSWVNTHFKWLIDDIAFVNKDFDLTNWDKWDILLKNNINMFIDDRTENANRAVEIWVDYVFLFNKPWNLNEKINNKIIRINYLIEILDYLK